MSKESNANMLDPNRFKIAKNMAVIPGGPENNNPMNVTDNASPPIQSQSIYGDFAQQYPQMGSGVLNQQMIHKSGLQQNFPLGQRNNGSTFGMQQQPATSNGTRATGRMERGREAHEGTTRGQE